ncbi:unnamed protein product [Leptidea sinapis]|uniref:Uncharacterized protein n=1 Tax=Leptidea sinapis TaxID=189913 RepID=A0A5E4PR65_9NEOP|nr:unnamed protein product [Leptidea sinapis]
MKSAGSLPSAALYELQDLGLLLRVDGPELESLRGKVRKLFNRAKNTRAPDDWDAYKQAQYWFKKRIRDRKRERWRRFCTSIESTNQAAKSRGGAEAMRPAGSLDTNEDDLGIVCRLITIY